MNKQEALIDLLTLKSEPELQSNRLYHATVGVFYQELNQQAKAIPCFETALKLSKSSSEKLFIHKRLKGQ